MMARTCAARDCASNPEKREQHNAHVRERYHTDADFRARGLAANAVRAKHRRSALRRELWDAQSGLCGICAQSMEYSDTHIDHIIPKSKGGSNERYNLQLTHSACNLRKGATW